MHTMTVIQQDDKQQQRQQRQQEHLQGENGINDANSNDFDAPASASFAFPLHSSDIAAIFNQQQQLQQLSLAQQQPNTSQYSFPAYPFPFAFPVPSFQAHPQPLSTENQSPTQQPNQPFPPAFLNQQSIPVESQNFFFQFPPLQYLSSLQQQIQSAQLSNAPVPNLNVEANGDLNHHHNAENNDTQQTSPLELNDDGTAKCRWFTCRATFTDPAELIPHLATAHIPANRNPQSVCKWGGTSCDVSTETHEFNSTDELVDHLCQTHIKGIIVEYHAKKRKRSDAGLSESESEDTDAKRVHGSCSENGEATVGSSTASQISQLTDCESISDNHAISSESGHNTLQNDQKFDLNQKLNSSSLYSSLNTASNDAATISGFSVLPESNSQTFFPMSSSTPSSPSSPNLHICLWSSCAQSFASFSELTIHISEAHVQCNKPSYFCFWKNCERGGKPFNQRQKCMRHIQTHTGDKPFECNMCHKRFSEQSVLIGHMRTHTGEKPFKCDYEGCGKEFSVLGALTVHKRVHTGEKPFACKFDGCDKRFSESSNLTKHLRTHSGDRPFACPYPACTKKFSRPDQVTRHQSTHNTEKKWTCTESSCGKRYKSESGLRGHIGKVHNANGCANGGGGGV